MTIAADAYTALQDAMTRTDPECRDDGRFILDDQPADTLAYICERCPLIDLCRAYAATERPSGGVWAGRRWAKTLKEKHND
ncbi:WhiB family transcriptional regulator [Plantibacter flavus]|uniref:WhiB family transcriptional regulator n=1 Tax=Plantibacter flavus TaxID=150123 RepID=UPI003392BE67